MYFNLSSHTHDKNEEEDITLTHRIVFEILVEGKMTVLSLMGTPLTYTFYTEKASKEIMFSSDLSGQFSEFIIALFSSKKYRVFV